MNTKEIAKQFFEFNDNEVARVDMIDLCRFADYVDAQAVAREREKLKALKPEWWVNPDDGSMVSQFSMIHCANTLKDKYTVPLYALDEVTK